MAATVVVGSLAYAKAMGHAAQHPHAAVDGVLLARARPAAAAAPAPAAAAAAAGSSPSTSTHGTAAQVVVVDAIPLRHSKNALSLGLTAALHLVEAYCNASGSDGWTIVGVYAAEAGTPTSPQLKEAPPLATQLANAVRERYGATLLLTIHNEHVFGTGKTYRAHPSMARCLGGSLRQAYRWTSAAGWHKAADAEVVLAKSDATREAVQRALAAGKQATLVDLDDSFDDAKCDWRNGGVSAWLTT